MDRTTEGSGPNLGEELRPELLARARRMLGRHHDAAEDVVQEAFLHLLRRVAEGTPPRERRPWLHAVVASLCIREAARARRRAGGGLAGIAATGGDPADVAQVRAEVRWAFGAVAGLPEREHAALLDDLAGVRGPREGANARHQALHRARRKLRSLRSAAWGVVPLPGLLGRGAMAGGAAAGVGPGAIIPGAVMKVSILASAAAIAAAGGGHVLGPVGGSAGDARAGVRDPSEARAGPLRATPLPRAARTAPGRGEAPGTAGGGGPSDRAAQSRGAAVGSGMATPAPLADPGPHHPPVPGPDRGAGPGDRPGLGGDEPMPASAVDEPDDGDGPASFSPAGELDEDADAPEDEGKVPGPSAEDGEAAPDGADAGGDSGEPDPGG